MVGVVVSDLRNQFYARLAAGIEQTLRAADYQMVLLSDNSESTEELAGARTFLAMRAPGVILTPVGHEAATLLARHGVAVVEIDRQLAKIPCDAIVIDNEGGGTMATQHLLELGHERIALLVAPTDWTTDTGRADGYRSALREAGVGVDERLILAIEPEAADAEARIERLLDEQRPTAIFGANNLLAERAWRVLRRRALALPGDVSLVAFDDMPWMTMVDAGHHHRRPADRRDGQQGGAPAPAPDRRPSLRARGRVLRALARRSRVDRPGARGHVTPCYLRGTP